MLFNKMVKIVKAVRFRYSILFVLLMVIVYIAIINPWMKNWGSTQVEQQMKLPGDEFYSNPFGYTTQAITIHASPDVIWQWLIQIGQDRAGFYTYTWLENLIGADIHNANEIHPEWQSLSVGDVWKVVPADYLGNLGKDAGFLVKVIEPNRVLVMELMGSYVLIPIDSNSTRLLVRGEAMPNNLLMKLTMEPIVFTMMRPMLLGLKTRAEGVDGIPIAFMMLAYLGWISTGIIIAYLFISSKKRIYWMAIPVVAVMPAILMAGDIQSGLAAFIAVGFTLVGFLIFGRDWWGPIFVIASVVLLTLLLVPEAFAVIGNAFVLILLGVLVSWHDSHQKSADNLVQNVGLESS